MKCERPPGCALILFIIFVKVVDWAPAKTFHRDIAKPELINALQRGYTSHQESYTGHYLQGDDLFIS